jgi:sugar O-acyltransferase (sialic acid O-acetyltransferase NeuD family)
VWEVLGFVADGVSHPESIAARGARILGELDFVGSLDPAEVDYVIGVGSPRDRQRLDAAMTARGFAAATVIHPSAVIGSLVAMGPGCYVGAQAVITTAVSLGRHVHVNVAASVSHDCVLGDYATVNPGARVAGRVTLGDGVYVGIGATLKDTINAGEWSVIGAGAAVIADVPPHATVVGVPARPLATNNTPR